jgi:uncharacterized protein VirK/YbjX
LKWFYRWRYYANQRKAIRYDGFFPNGGGPKYETLYNIHIEKMRWYATKLGWMK